MANCSLKLNTELYDYMLTMGLREPAVLQQLRQATDHETLSIMRSAPEQGQLMALLLRLMGARRGLEIGTYTGYATLWMAQALPDDGKIITCDISERWTSVARRFWHKSGQQHKIKLHLGPAIETLQRLLSEAQAGLFDFAFIDADKESYQEYYECCLQLIRSGGIIIIDNVLWGGSVIDDNNQTTSTLAIRAFNLALQADERIEICMLPVGDGITLARKK